MKCPNCDRYMDGICMSGDDTEINHELYCNYCHTYLRYSYNPQVTNRIISQDKLAIDNGLPY